MRCGRYHDDDGAYVAQRMAAAAVKHKEAAEKIARFFAEIVGAPNVEVASGSPHVKVNKLFLSLRENLLVQHRGHVISVKTSDVSRVVSLFNTWRAKEMVHVRVVVR